MHNVAHILIGLALAGTVFSLGAGLLTFLRGEGEEASQKSNQFMRGRLFFQALVLLLVSLAFLF